MDERVEGVDEATLVAPGYEQPEGGAESKAPGQVEARAPLGEGDDAAHRGSPAVAGARER